MPRFDNLPQSAGRDLVNHRRRLEVLERTARDKGRSRAPIPPFNQPGDVTVADSPRWRAYSDYEVSLIHASLRTAGTTTTTVKVRKNGTDWATVSLTSGQTAVDFDFGGTPEVLAIDDLLTVDVTVAGTGAKRLDVQFLWE